MSFWNNFMKLHFAYNIEKDIENFIKGTNATNSKKPTKFQISFSEKYGENFEAEKEMERKFLFLLRR